MPASPTSTQIKTPLAWSVIRFFAGLAIFGVAAVLAYVAAHAVAPTPIAIAIVVSVLVVVPGIATRLLLPGLKRIDSTSTFLNSWPGLAVIWCVILVGLFSWSARRWFSHALQTTPNHEPDFPPWSTRILARVGKWLEPPPPPRPPAISPVTSRGPTVATARDGGVALDAGATPSTAPTDVLENADAALDSAESPPDREYPAIDIEPCDHVVAVRALELGHGSPDELVITCRDGVLVLWLEPQPTLFVRTRFAVQTPPDLVLEMRPAWISDLDADGRRDVAICAYFTSQRGGTRGGKSWWARARSDGNFLTPAGLDHGECAAVTSGDVTGDHVDELFVVREGNPWMDAHPNGSLFWYARVHGRWQLRGNTQLFPAPEMIWLDDADHDGFQDVFVGDEQHAVTWFAGSASGIHASDAGVPATTPPPVSSMRGDFDGDRWPDRIEIDLDRRHVRVFTTVEPRAMVRHSDNALDYADYTLTDR